MDLDVGLAHILELRYPLRMHGGSGQVEWIHGTIVLALVTHVVVLALTSIPASKYRYRSTYFGLSLVRGDLRWSNVNVEYQVLVVATSSSQIRESASRAHRPSHNCLSLFHYGICYELCDWRVPLIGGDAILLDGHSRCYSRSEWDEQRWKATLVSRLCPIQCCWFRWGLVGFHLDG